MRSPSIIALLLVQGCVDPSADLDAFRSRLPRSHPSDAGVDATDGAACAPKPGDIEGQFLLAISASIGPTKPIVVLADVTTPAFGTGTGIAFSAQPLSATDRATPVGSRLSLGPFPIDATGSFRADIPGLTVTGAANPLTPGADITADLVLTGNLCGKSRFYCGNVSGRATKPLTLNLDGSTFTLTAIDAGGSIPSRPKIDCQGTLADPL